MSIEDEDRRVSSQSRDDGVNQNRSAMTALPILTLGRNEGQKTSIVPSVLPISIPPATLRPLAFRAFTRKHGLTLNASALQSLADFVGRECGAGWREDGLAERVLDEIAKEWKQEGGSVLVDGQAPSLRRILSDLRSFMEAGKIQKKSGNAQLRRSTTISEYATAESQPSATSTSNGHLEDANESANSSQVQNHGTGAEQVLRIVGAFHQPRLEYDVAHRRFEITKEQPALLAGHKRKMQLFRQRYHLVHQRMLRHPSFQPSLSSRGMSQSATGDSTIEARQNNKITPIANLLGRGGTTHILLGLLSTSPSGLLTINDLTGSIGLDLQHTHSSPGDATFLCPGMIVIVDGQYEDEESQAGSGLDGNNGVGGAIGGVFVAFVITGPPCERRDTTLDVSHALAGGRLDISTGFGWTNFLGVGSERTNGSQMRALQKQMFQHEGIAGQRGKIVIIGEINLDDAKSIKALRAVLSIYSFDPEAQRPLAIVMMGSFVRTASMCESSGGTGSIEYKENFDTLASTLSDYSDLLQKTKFVFVPGDNDPWESASAAGATSSIPRAGIPELFTSRVRKEFTAAKSRSERADSMLDGGEAIWTTNPARLSLFGPVHEIVLFRDDISSRLRRTSINFGATSSDENRNNGSANASLEADSMPFASRLARKLVKTILDQGHLSPFPLSTRPVQWDYAASLSLYPLPTALVLMDKDAPRFAISLEGSHVMNPGTLCDATKRNNAQWIEYDIRTSKGKLRDCRY